MFSLFEEYLDKKYRLEKRKKKRKKCKFNETNETLEKYFK